MPDATVGNAAVCAGAQTGPPGRTPGHDHSRDATAHSSRMWNHAVIKFEAQSGPKRSVQANPDAGRPLVVMPGAATRTEHPVFIAIIDRSLYQPPR